MKKKIILDKLFIFVPLLILLIISLFNMYFVSIKWEGYESYLFKQSLWFGIGFVMLFIFYLLKPKLFFRYSKYLYAINILLLILVLFFGTTVNGSKAWFKFPFFSFQPSELMKFTLALYLSHVLSQSKKGNMKQEFKAILKALFITLIPGIIIVIFISIFGYLYYFNQDLLIDLIGTSFFYRVDRLLTFVNNDSFQLDRALISIGTSSFFSGNGGVYIPEAPTDFIVALSISNLGIISFIAGFLMMFIFAQVQNIGMNLGILPIIGLPLPFVSYGGTNIIVYFMFLGILVNLKKS